MRKATITRKTKETDITVTVNIDGSGKSNISTGVGFFDHMLTAFSLHSKIDIDLTVDGDIEVDFHHTVEDTGIVLGQAIDKALGDKKGINRYGLAYIPMDESLGFATVDICGRPYLVYSCDFEDSKSGEYDNCLTREFFRALAFNSQITMHVNLVYGHNDHHKNEAMFKALAHSMRQAVSTDSSLDVLSTKGVL